MISRVITHSLFHVSEIGRTDGRTAKAEGRNCSHRSSTHQATWQRAVSTSTFTFKFTDKSELQLAISWDETSLSWQGRIPPGASGTPQSSVTVPSWWGRAWPFVQISNSKTVVSEGAGSPDQARQPQTTNYHCKASLTSTKHVCEISGFCRGAVEGYYALQPGSWLPTFRDSPWSHIYGPGFLLWHLMMVRQAVPKRP